MNVKFSKDVLVLNKFLLTDPIFSLISQTLFCKRVGLLYVFKYEGQQQFGNFTSLLSLRFYVKSIFGILEMQKFDILTHLQALNFDFY